MDGNDKNTNSSRNKECIENKNNLIDGYAKIEDFTKDGFKALIEATKNSNSLPQERDWDFYNTHESFKNLMTSEGNEILQIINNILKQQSVFGNIKHRDLDEKIELVIEANDIILERVANNLDELAGIRKNPQLPVEIQTVSAELPISGSWNKINHAKITVETSPMPTQSIIQSPNSIRLLTGKNIQRPQKYFKDRIDNCKTPWEPRIKDKPNNLKPLAVYLEYTDDGAEEIFCHPYEFELERFEPSPKQLTKIIPSVPRTLDDTPLHLIEAPDQLDAMLQDLRKYHEISIDLEHHSYRSYMGITCLMQISTGETDYLVDALKLRDKLHVLNEIFTRPSVVKVFHGADMDILWLQRDLSLYVVNMFDTHQAAKQLGYPHLSLAYLLRRFCQIDADKHFQLADWRIRPLPDELKTYAREDTHYLLYIYHMMRNELLAQGENVLKAVITNSTQICKKRYEKPIMREDSHMELYRKCKKLFDNRQMFALKHLYQWRDDLAREEDESTGFVLPNHMMLQIAELLPREMQGILACCNPIPPLVRANLLELHKIILKAREQSIIKPILSEDTRNRGSTQHTTKINIDNVLNCPHDLLKTEEFRDDLPTLLGSIIPGKILKNDVIIDETTTLTQFVKPKINIFETPDNSDDETKTNTNTNNKNNNKMSKLKFLGPYERYKLVKSYMQAEEKKIVDDQNKNETEKNDTNTNDSIENKSNAERLAALQEHFKVMAAATNQIVPPEKSPSITGKIGVTLGRQSEKRKRCDEDEDEYVDPNEIINTQKPETNTQQYHQQQQQHQQQNTNNKKKKQRGKKKSNNNKNNQVESLMQQKKSEKRNKNKNKQNIQTRSNNQHEQQQHQQQQQRNQQKVGRYHQQQNKQNKQQQHNSNQNQEEYRAPKRKRNESNNLDNQQQQQQQQQNNKRQRRSENFKPFDYSTVNFQQFQGGAGSAHQPKNVGSNFKSRGSKNNKTQNIGKSNAKSATFGGNNNNNRGRGGGGGRGGRGGSGRGGRGGRGSGRYY